MKLAPTPDTQFVPPLTVYSHVVSAANPVTLTVPTLVMPSLPLAPVSLTSTKPRLDGLVVSISGSPSAAFDTLPAASVKLALTVMLSVPANSPALAVYVSTASPTPPAASVKSLRSAPVRLTTAPLVTVKPAAYVAFWASATTVITGAASAV